MFVDLQDHVRFNPTPHSSDAMHNNLSVLTQCEYFRLSWSEEGELRFLSHMGESGLLRYTRRVYICAGRKLTPGMLLPHLRHFQSLDRVHTLSLKCFDAIPWANHHETGFLHFYPTLTSLILRDPSGPYRPLMRFALQFPNLETLTLDRSVTGDQFGPGVSIPTTASQPTPLRLRLVGYRPWIEWPPAMDFINFRSVEFDDSYGVHAQYGLDVCAHTLESLTLVLRRNGASRPSYLRLLRWND